MGVEYYMVKKLKEYDVDTKKYVDKIQYCWVGGSSVGMITEEEYNKYRKRFFTLLEELEDFVISVDYNKISWRDKMIIDTFKNRLYLTFEEIMNDDIHNWTILKWMFAFGEVNFVYSGSFELDTMRYDEWYLLDEYTFDKLMEDCKKKKVEAVRFEL